MGVVYIVVERDWSLTLGLGKVVMEVHVMSMMKTMAKRVYQPRMIPQTCILLEYVQRLMTRRYSHGVE